MQASPIPREKYHGLEEIPEEKNSQSSPSDADAVAVTQPPSRPDPVAEESASSLLLNEAAKRIQTHWRRFKRRQELQHRDTRHELPSRSQEVAAPVPLVQRLRLGTIRLSSRRAQIDTDRQVRHLELTSRLSEYTRSAFQRERCLQPPGTGQSVALDYEISQGVETHLETRV